MDRPKTIYPKALLVNVLQWFYLLLTLLSLSIPFIYQNYFNDLGFPRNLVIGISIVLAVYCLLLSVSFFTQITNLLILSLVFIFFTSLGALALLIFALPNASAVISGDLPKCYTALDTCNLKDGIIVSAAYFLTVAIPTLLINIITIIGVVKGIAAKD